LQVAGSALQTSGGLVQSEAWQHSLPSTQVVPPQQVWPAVQQVPLQMGPAVQQLSIGLQPVFVTQE